MYTIVNLMINNLNSMNEFNNLVLISFICYYYYYILCIIIIIMYNSGKFI